MASIVVSGDTSGAVTLSAPSVAGTTTVTLPSSTGTMALLQTPSFATTIGVGGATASASGSGISFPATQSASSDANTLDDYEEGTWTPSVGGNATYINQVGQYTKIGNFVKIKFHLEINTLGTGSTLAITGIPFTPTSSDPNIVGGVVTYIANLATSALAIGIYVQSTGYIYFMTRNSSATSATTQQPAVIGNGTNIYAEASYLV